MPSTIAAARRESSIPCCRCCTCASSIGMFRWFTMTVDTTRRGGIFPHHLFLYTELGLHESYTADVRQLQCAQQQACAGWLSSSYTPRCAAVMLYWIFCRLEPAAVWTCTQCFACAEFLVSIQAR